MRLDFGCVWVNCHIPLQAEMPHGGFKHSGYGKDLSLYGLEDYTRIKHVMQYHGYEGPTPSAHGFRGLTEPPDRDLERISMATRS